MAFSFEELKKLYALNSLERGADGNYYVVDRLFKNRKDDVNPDYVMFSQAWVDSILYCINVMGIQVVDEFDYTFNKEAEKVYEKIMEYSKLVFKNTNSVMEKDALISVIRQDTGLRENSYMIVEGLYRNDNNYASFINWIKSSVDYMMNVNEEESNKLL